MVGDAAAWQSFYLMTGGAAAVLTGLVFVALSARSPWRRSLPQPPERGVRATPLTLSKTSGGSAIG